MTRWDAGWLERMYDNRARVPAYAEHFARWRADAERARADHRGRVRLDVRYGPGEGETLDVFLPRRRRAGAAPILVFIHGGYWRSLDKADHSFVATPFTDAGAVVVVPNYALCPAVTISDIACQTVAALAWVCRQAAEWGGDPDAVTVVGHSAGGHLAAMALLCDWPRVGPDLPPRWLRRAVSISGLFDLEPLRHTPFLQADLRLTARDAARCSPARLPPPDGVRLQAWVGGDESEAFLAQNALIRDAWGRTRVPVCRSAPGRQHFSVLEALVEPGHALHQAVRGWLGV